MGRFRNAGRGARQVRNVPIGGNGRILKNTARDLCRPSALVKGGRLDSKGVQHDRRGVVGVGGLRLIDQSRAAHDTAKHVLTAYTS